eukprot:jgi/Ulvmu1/4606/UM002_0335.1
MTDPQSLELHEAHEAYKQDEFAACQAKCTEIIKAALPPLQSVAKLLRACAFFRLGKFSRALSDCSEVAGQADPRVTCPANQLKGECFLRDDDKEAALEAFQTAEKQNAALKKGAIKAYIAAAGSESDGIDTDVLEKFSVANCTDSILDILQPTAKKANVEVVSQRVDKAMARPGPSVRAEDLAQAPFAGNIELLAPSKYRMQFNQNGPNVEVQVFAKQLNKKRERVTVEIHEKSLRVEIKSEDMSQTEYLLEEDLYHAINVEGSKWDIWATQVNIKLRKGDPSIVWPSLAHTDTPAVQGGASIVDVNAAPATSYPSSHRKAQHDWNKLENDVKQEEKDEKLDGDAGLQKFFSQLYAGADEDTRRAMNKSFQESGGTSLSTNWKDVQKQDFECKPPEGVKVKKFEQ